MNGQSGFSVFVISGASANLLTMTTLKVLHPEGGEIICASLGTVGR